MEENICVSVRLLDRPENEQPEPFFIDASLKWQDLEAMIRALYEIPEENIDVRYLDDENDQVMISCQEEFAWAVLYCKDTENMLQLVVRSKSGESAASETTVTAETCPATGEEAEVEEMCPEVEGTKQEKENSPPTEEQEHVMVPGATSGANAVAIEMPECPMEVDNAQAEKQEVETLEKEDISASHHTEAAEPAEMAETGEVAHKAGRDAETGYWMIAGSAKKRKTPTSGEKTELPLPESGAKAASEKPTVVKNLKKRDRQAEALAIKSEKRHKSDKESKDDLSLSGSGSMSFPAFVAFMGKLKKELRSEIVHDVTRKTVKQVLRGLETLQLQAQQSDSNTPPPHDGKTRANNWPVFTHDDILCDNCERTIVGPRYKCGNCLNYDLCEECENIAGVHDENHVFLKLRRPCHMAGYRHSKRVPLLKHLVYTTKIIEECPEPELELDKIVQSQGEVDMERLARKAEKLKHMQLKMKEKLARKEEKLKRKYERLSTQAKDQLPPLLKRERIEVPYGRLGADFVCDMTLPDGILVQPGERLTKTWRMRNSGTMAWPPGTVLREMWSSMPAEKAKVSVPQVAPGDEVDITVHLIAPTSAGRYQSHWRLHCNGKLVGHIVYCMVEVEKDADTKSETEAAPAVVPMLKELCCDNVGPLGSQMTHLTLSEKHVKQEVDSHEEEQEELQEDGGLEGEEEEEGVEDDAGAHASTAEPLSVAGMTTMLSFVMVDVAQAEQPKCAAPQVVKQSYEDKFWAKELRALPGQGEPATPNNTPLDVSPPPERVIPIPEPELLRKLSLEAEASPQQEPDQPSSSEITATVTPTIREETEAAQSSSAEDVSSASGLELLEPTPIGPHQEIEGEVMAATENGLRAGRHLNDQDGALSGRVPTSELHWWEERESSPASTASSVEVVSAGELEGEAEADGDRPTDLSSYMAKHTLFPPHGWTEDLNYDHLDVESLDSLSDEDSSIDDDFFIVKLPDCFDTSKPLMYNSTQTYASSSSVGEYLAQQRESTGEAPEAAVAKSDDEEEKESISQQPSLDDMLQASGSITAPTLVPTAAPTSSQPSAGSDTSDTPAQAVDDTCNVEAAAGEFQDAPESPEDDGTPSSSAADATSAESVHMSGERLAGESEGAEGGAAAGATGAEDNACEPLDPSQQVNQLMQSAVAVASKAAVRAFTTAKDVFYTLQARQYEWKPSTWKPPQSTWKPPQSKWTPPVSTWKPPADEWKPPTGNWKPPTDDWKPPSDEWVPPQDWDPAHETTCKEPMGDSGVDGESKEDEEAEIPTSEPMTRLWEMGFFNRTLNQRLLEKHNGDLEPVVQELLQDLDNNWAESRH